VAGGIGFGFLAGLLSTLSPCVLPLLPLVLGAAAAAHRLGMLALAAGLVVSFVTVGLFLATIGYAIGLDAGVVRVASAVLLGGLGLVLLSGALQMRLATATAGIGDAGNHLLTRLAPTGLGGQFIVGLVLGAIWSPCVGPTLGAASTLAAQGKDLGAVAGVMVAFGAGAALPLLLVGALSREAMRHWRGRLMQAGSGGKYLLGGGAVVVAGLILTGWDHALEAVLVNHSPDWLVDLTTRF